MPTQSRLLPGLLWILVTTFVSLPLSATAEPQGCLCKAGYKKTILEAIDPTPPHKKRKIEKMIEVEGLLHCLCGKQECVIAATPDRGDINLSCVER